MQSAKHAESHKHHWILEEPEGETSEGRCLSCGATKTFRNWFKETDYLTQNDWRFARGN